MQSSLASSTAAFTQSSTTRILRIDTHWRLATAQFKAHYDQIDNTAHARMRGLGANFVLRGSGSYTDYDGRTYPLKPGVFFQRLPGRKHQTWFDPTSDYAEFFLALDRITSASLLQIGLVTPNPIMEVGVSSLHLEEMAHLITVLETTESEMSTQAVLVCVVKFLNGMYERARKAQNEDGWPRLVSRACQLLECSLEERIGAEAVALELGVPYPTFRRRFRAIMGTAPGEYRIRCRLERACVLLRDSSVQQVAANMGYPDPFTFSAQFKRFLGQSPHQFQSDISKKLSDR